MSTYNWDEIVKSKSDSELLSFFYNDFVNDYEAKYLTICEIELRNIRNADLESMKIYLYNNCEKRINSLNKKSLREYLIIYNPYFILILALYFFISFIAHPRFSFNNFYFDYFLFFSAGSIVAFIVSWIRIKSINSSKKYNIEMYNAIIKKLSIK